MSQPCLIARGQPPVSVTSLAFVILPTTIRYAKNASYDAKPQSSNVDTVAKDVIWTTDCQQARTRLG